MLQMFRNWLWFSTAAAPASRYVTLADIPTWANAAPTNKPATETAGFQYRPDLNQKISLYQGDITKLQLDAIVNAANSRLLGGGGVDGAIHHAAGHELLQECKKLNGCATGKAKITKGYKLPAKHVIHTVGPVGEKPALLASCYRNSLDLAVKSNIHTIAFPAISTGVYGYPSIPAAKVVLETVRTWLETDNNASKIDRIVFCSFSREQHEEYVQLCPLYFPSS